MVKKPFFIFFLLALVIPFCWSAGALKWRYVRIKLLVRGLAIK